MVIRLQGKAIILNKLQQVFNRPVTVDDVRYVFPFGIRLNQLNIEGILFAPQVHLSFSSSLFDFKNVQLSYVLLDDAVVTVHRQEDAHASQINLSNAQPSQADDTVLSKASAVGLRIETIAINNGSIVFPSHQSSNPMFFTLKEVNLKAHNIYFSTDAPDVSFELTARILDGDHFSGPNQLKGQGWFNWPKRNMSAKATVSQWRGNADVDLQIDSQNNQMLLKGHLKSQPAAVEDASLRAESANDIVANLFPSASMALDMNFSLQTQMDKWELRNIEFSGNVGTSLDSGK